MYEGTRISESVHSQSASLKIELTTLERLSNSYTPLNAVERVLNSRKEIRNEIGVWKKGCGGRNNIFYVRKYNTVFFMNKK